MRDRVFRQKYAREAARNVDPSDRMPTIEDCVRDLTISGVGVPNCLPFLFFLSAKNRIFGGFFKRGWRGRQSKIQFCARENSQI